MSFKRSYFFLIKSGSSHISNNFEIFSYISDTEVKWFNSHLKYIAYIYKYSNLTYIYIDK